MSAVVRILSLLARLANFGQILLYLPLTLDIAGTEAMLALSLCLASYYGTTSTLGLITRNTRFRWISNVVVLAQYLVVPALLLFILNVFSVLDSVTSAAAFFRREDSGWMWSAFKRAPSVWEYVLRTSSPVFVILEGMSTLLCIQATSALSKTMITRSPNPDVLQVLCLVGASSIYVVTAYFLHIAYRAISEPTTGLLVGVAITTCLFLSGIAFSMQKGNVIETSLMLAYSVFQIYHLSNGPSDYSASLLRALQGPTKSGNPPLPPLVLRSFNAIANLVSHTFGASLEFAKVTSSALPLPVLVGLFYRVAVLYAASRIIIALKRKNEGYENKRLSEEEPAARLMTLIVAYSRFILIAVYTHLLLLSNSGHQAFWQWLNIFLTLGLWGVEISIGRQEDASWKDD